MSNLVSAAELLARLNEPDLRLVDVRFDLADPAAGRRAYLEGHLPGAVHLDLEQDLSSPVAPGGRGGRHPLPDPQALATRLGRLGIGDGHEVVVYDAGSDMFAARAWWLLRWLGHERVRVLDGGVEAWRQASGPWESEPPSPTPVRHSADPAAEMVVDGDWVERRLDDPSTLLVDARAGERYRGEREPIDPRAGHIPGAINRPFAGNLAGGRFLGPDELRRRYAGLDEAERVVVYCGSGVSATHDALAMVEAGLPLPLLYAGSWSDWSSRTDAPLATGDPEGEGGGG